MLADIYKVIFFGGVKWFYFQQVDRTDTRQMQSQPYKTETSWQMAASALDSNYVTSSFKGNDYKIVQTFYENSSANYVICHHF